MKKTLTISAAVLLLVGASAQAQQRPLPTLNARQQAMLQKLNSNPGRSTTLQPATAGKTTGLQKQRIKSIFVNFGSGDDSLTYYYNGVQRGSSYDYSLIGAAFAAYDGGFHYLNDALSQASFDSLYYITRNDHVSPYEPYLHAYAGYDTAQHAIAGHTDRPGTGNVFGPYSSFANTYTPSGDLSSSVAFRWNAGLQQYDTSLLATYGYTAPGKLTNSESYFFTYPYPTRTGQEKKVNYYTTSGLLFRSDVFAWDIVTHNWEIQPYERSIYSFTPAGKAATLLLQPSANGDTLRHSYTYNAAGQLITDSVASWNASLGWAGNWNPIPASVTRYTYPATMGDWGRMSTTIINPLTMLWGHLQDTVTKTFDAQQQLLTSKRIFDDGYGGLYYVNEQKSWFATGKPLHAETVTIDASFTDTITSTYNLTYNSSNEPVIATAKTIDAYGNTIPDVWLDMYERFGYESYYDNTGVKSANAKKSNLTIFPNPASRALTLRCAAMRSATMTMTNSHGHIVRRHLVDLGNSDAIIDISSLPAGLYFVTVKDASQHEATSRFLKP